MNQMTQQNKINKLIFVCEIEFQHIYSGDALAYKFKSKINLSQIFWEFPFWSETRVSNHFSKKPHRLIEEDISSSSAEKIEVD